MMALAVAGPAVGWHALCGRPEERRQTAAGRRDRGARGGARLRRRRRYRRSWIRWISRSCPTSVVIPVGSSLSFPNSDAVSHQVYSFSPTRRFQLPLYRGKPYPPVDFDQPGIVTLGCNIHDNMLAYVVVTNAPLFGRTGDKGEWVAHNVPEGTYRIKLWHPRLKEPVAMRRAHARASTATAASSR